MTDLTAAKRKKMPQSEFAGPGHSFPVNDATHQRLAISGATRSERAGNISPEEAASIKAKARALLNKGDAKTTRRHRSSKRLDDAMAKASGI